MRASRLRFREVRSLTSFPRGRRKTTTEIKICGFLTLDASTSTQIAFVRFLVHSNGQHSLPLLLSLPSSPRVLLLSSDEVPREKEDRRYGTGLAIQIPSSLPCSPFPSSSTQVVFRETKETINRRIRF